jgi:hypothetical protein
VRRKFEMNLESPKLDFRHGRHCTGRTPLIFKSGLGPTQICHQGRFIGVLLLERAPTKLKIYYIFAIQLHSYLDNLW